MWLQLGFGVGMAALIGLLLWAAYRAGASKEREKTAKADAKAARDDLDIAAAPAPGPDSIIDRMRRGEM